MSRVVLRGKVHDQGRRVGGVKAKRAVTGTFPTGVTVGFVLLRGIGGILVERDYVWADDTGWGVGPYSLDAMLRDLEGLEVTVVVANEEVDLNELLFGDVPATTGVS